MLLTNRASFGYLAVVAICFAVATAADAEPCQGYIGKVVTPISVSEAAKPYKKILPKGEFETTAQYNEKVSKILENAPPVVVIRSVIEKSRSGTDPAKYDADTQNLIIRRWLFENPVGSFIVSQGIGYGTDIYEEFDFYRSQDISATVSRKERLLGSYTGSNAFGASVIVQKKLQKFEVIFERTVTPIGTGSDDLIPRLEPDFDLNTYDIVGRVPLPPEEARRLKPILGAALVVEPFKPYVVEAEYTVAPTISYRVERENHATILFADFKCALVLGENDTVLASFKTN